MKWKKEKKIKWERLICGCQEIGFELGVATIVDEGCDNHNVKTVQPCGNYCNAGSRR